MNERNDSKLHPVDMLHMYEAFVSGHEETLKEELESGNFGEDFADAIYICRRLLEMVKDLKKEPDMPQIMMTNALLKCLRDEWDRINPYMDPANYPEDWRRFCEDKFNKIARG